jgi:hypothetical protein
MPFGARRLLGYWLAPFFMIRLYSLRIAIASSLLFAAGCRREQIRVYVAPPEAPADGMGAHDSPHGTPADKAEEAQIGWQLPNGWRETEASSVNFASFRVPSASGGEAGVSISQFPNLKDREPFIVNMWREQVGLGPLPEAEATKAFSAVTVAGAPGESFEVSGTREGKSVRIVTAVLHRGETSWFFKLSGDETTVQEHKPEFFEFVRTIRFMGAETPPPQASASEPPPSAPAPQEKPASPLKWPAPSDWTSLTPGQMQVGKFSVPEQNGAKAEVAVSIFPSDTGGTLANVNRWRSQLGLEPTDDAGLATCVQALEGGGTLIDLTNEQRQLVGAIIPRDGRWWFYKMLGDAPAVAAAKDAFVRFVKTAP